jgi:hypothetical protein
VAVLVGVDLPMAWALLTGRTARLSGERLMRLRTSLGLDVRSGHHSTPTPAFFAALANAVSLVASVAPRRIASSR